MVPKYMHGPLKGLDSSRTVGCLAAPLVVQVESRSSPGDALKESKERLRKALQGARAPAGEPDASLCWRASLVLPDPWQADRLIATAIPVPRLRIEGHLEGGCLRFEWTSGSFHRREDLERLAGRFLKTLGALVKHCQSPEAGGYTPSDFPVSGLDQADLDQLLTELG